MCGIIGVVNGTAGNDKRLTSYFSDALYAGQVRGLDGTGMFQIKDSYGAEIYMDKVAWNGTAFSHKQTGNAPLLLKDVGNSFLTVGHHRHATVGKVNDESSHPFLINRDDRTQLIGVHNGTLVITGAEAAKAAAYRVDSEYLMAKLAEEGPEDALRDVYGAVATVFHDTREPSKFYMYTNGQRPLHFAFIAGNPEAMLIASEAEMLFWLATRNKIGIYKDEIYTCKSRRLYTFDNLGKLTDYKTKDISFVSNTTSASPGMPWNMGQRYSEMDMYDDDDSRLASWLEDWSTPKGYTEARQDLRAQLKGAVSEILGESDEGPVEAGPTCTAPASTQTTTSVTPAEYTCLKQSLNIAPGTEVCFEAEAFWPEKGILRGVVTVDGVEEDIYMAEVRNVTQEQANFWLDKVPGYSRAMGAYVAKSPYHIEGDAEPAAMEFNIVCTQPRLARAAVLVKPEPSPCA